jgi:hypothetical protein
MYDVDVDVDVDLGIDDLKVVSSFFVVVVGKTVARHLFRT